MELAKGHLEVEVPWAETITAYDEAHFVTYLRILDAKAAGARLDDIAAIILHIDPRQEPEKASRAAASHLRRAEWMTTYGYRHLLAS